MPIEVMPEMTIVWPEVNHKGGFCPYRKGLLCQEGFCSGCEVAEQRRIIVYISAPYTRGDISRNIRNACLAGNEILKMGAIPLVPHLSHLWHIISPKSYEEWMEIDLALLPRTDGVLRLPGKSEGADREVILAKKLGIPIYYSIQEIQELVR